MALSNNQYHWEGRLSVIKVLEYLLFCISLGYHGTVPVVSLLEPAGDLDDNVLAGVVDLRAVPAEPSVLLQNTLITSMTKLLFQSNQNMR